MMLFRYASAEDNNVFTNRPEYAWKGKIPRRKDQMG